MKKIVTRFAVSPTGQMHVGGVRTALFGYLAARNAGGKYILRIEDTDKAREVEGAVDQIIESLHWLGITWDEGPDVGGPKAPYTQSERLDIYKKYAQKLVDSGNAYVDPYTTDQVDAFREEAKAAGRPFLFRAHRPDEVTKWDGKSALRLKVPEIKRYAWNDLSRGRLSAGEESLDDFVLMKADGYPTYNFAHVVDDYEMGVTHVIRGEEFISSMPNFLALHDAMGIEWPEFTTAPLILAKEGGKKLSKRDGAKSVLEYRDDGYTPEAVMNFLASLGWNDGTNKEIYTPEELIKEFSLSRIQKSGAKFDDQKLDWMNWQYIKRVFAEGREGSLELLGIEDAEFQKNAAELVMTKSRNAEDFKKQMAIFTEVTDMNLSEFDLSNVDEDMDAETAVKLLGLAAAELEKIDDFNSENVEKALRSLLETTGETPRRLLNLTRWSVARNKVSPNLFDMIAVIGKSESIARITDFTK